MWERLHYWRRIFKVYLTPQKGYLDFWHERPEVTPHVNPNALGAYYMTFADKAEYKGPRDARGVILFDYFSNIGRQYNPVAIAQYGLGAYNKFLETHDEKYLHEARIQGNWLCENLFPNEFGIPVWKHDFEWHYKKVLSKGWYSALSQGNGISLLARLHKTTGDEKYLRAARDAFRAMTVSVEKGGVQYRDEEGNIWLEEYILIPPTHILNGFIWALWGVWDYALLTGDEGAKKIFHESLKTLHANMKRFDAGFWSLYDLSRQAMKMVASPFYHKLHIVQLYATSTLTHDSFFADYAKKFEEYEKSFLKRNLALLHKAIFKIFYF